MANSLDVRRLELLAYQIWEQEGRPCGRDREHWQMAEKQLEIEFRVGFPVLIGNGDPDSHLSGDGAEDEPVTYGTSPA